MSRKLSSTTGLHTRPHVSATPSQISLNKKSHEPDYGKANVSVRMDSDEKQRTEYRSTKRAHNSSSDSDKTKATFDGMDEKRDTSVPKPSPDLTDKTLLPCEFCKKLIPADSLDVHQENCVEVPSKSLRRNNQKNEKTNVVYLSSEQEEILRSLSDIRIWIDEIPTDSDTLKDEFEKLSTKVDKFFDDQKKQNDEFQKSQVEVSDLKKEVAELKKEVADLKNKVVDLKKKLSESEEKVKSLGEAHATWMWESHATRFVMSPKVQQNKFSQYRQMNKCLEEEKRYGKDGQQSLKRWEQLQNALCLEWTEDHDDLVKTIREKRNYVAHPPNIDLDEVEENIKHDATQSEVEYINGLFNMLKLTASLMKCGKLANDFSKNRKKPWFKHIFFSREQEKALSTMADWDRDLQQVQNGRLHSMPSDDAMRYLKKYVQNEEGSSFHEVVNEILKANRNLLGNLAWEFEERALAKERMPEFEKFIKTTQKKEWCPSHTNALEEMKRLVSEESRGKDIPHPQTAKCIIPDFLKKSLWSYAIDIVEWFKNMPMPSCTKRKSSEEGFSHAKRARRK